MFCIQLSDLEHTFAGTAENNTLIKPETQALQFFPDIFLLLFLFLATFSPPLTFLPLALQSQ